MPHRDHPDGNAADLYANLEKVGWVCVRIATAVQHKKGVPDAIVARKGDRYRRTHLLEVKSLGGRLSPEQIAFAMTWPGCVHCGSNSWEVEQLLKECESQNLSICHDQSKASA